MAHLPLTEPTGPAVFRGPGKLGHLRCRGRDAPKRLDTSDRPLADVCEAQAQFLETANR